MTGIVNAGIAKVENWKPSIDLLIFKSKMQQLF
jgi:hypothetical protein